MRHTGLVSTGARTTGHSRAGFYCIGWRDVTTSNSRPVLTTAVAVLALLGAAMAASGPARAVAGSKPYDDKLFRLAEILGAVHYLRELCSANDGQAWRERMRELIESEGTTALRKASLTRSFNQGYRSYSRTYISCTPSAQSTITRFLTEGAEISDALSKETR